MRKPRPEAFDPAFSQKPGIKPELVDLSDAVGISVKPPKPTPKKLSEPVVTLGNIRPSQLQESPIEVIRKAVKQFGKEAATHRFTKEEKQGIAELVYSYSHKGIRTSENEIARIAVNFLLDDQKRNGANSLLDQVLRVLNN